jgi:hypothetical protein
VPASLTQLTWEKAVTAKHLQRHTGTVDVDICVENNVEAICITAAAAKMYK